MRFIRQADERRAKPRAVDRGRMTGWNQQKMLNVIQHIEHNIGARNYRENIAGFGRRYYEYVINP